MQLNQKLEKIPFSLIRKIGQEAKQIPDCILLTIGEPDFSAPVPVRTGIAEAIRSGDTHYPPNAGTFSFRCIVTDYVNQRFSTHYDTQETLICVGSTEALASALFAIINPGDEVIVPVPARNNMPVKMSVNSSSRNSSKIYAHVEAVRIHDCLEDPDGL